MSFVATKHKAYKNTEGYIVCLPKYTNNNNNEKNKIKISITFFFMC